ncbi:hypothetical protein EWW49_25985 [Pseudomonas syringae]|uniref:hypothetical protein n=1 Tax=Pseudomonas sp. MWU16-30316 TaxID=2878093 RepID=UPI0011030F90|nr:hypothetical protein [Pseudomonas sp. MWU16-30316]TFZ34279.1 hypothetical protein EWW49_25985 [Pseudomonas syringae]
MKPESHSPSADEAEARRHAQEYRDLIRSATSRDTLDQALLGALGYFQSLLNCGLIQEQTCHELNQKAMAQADALQAELLSSGDSAADT